MDPFIIIDREDFALTLFWHTLPGPFWRVKRSPVTVGKPGDETPQGFYKVLAKTRRPDWQIPEHRDYAPETWGTIIKFGEPGNPFAEGFISLGAGLGIHATSFPPEVGTASSHGCARMRRRDFRKIYDRVPLGMRVVII